MSQTANASEKLEGAELRGVEPVTARRIVADMDMTPVRSITRVSDAEFKVSLFVDGGFCAFGSVTSKYAIKSVIGRGNSETLTLEIVEKSV